MKKDNTLLIVLAIVAALLAGFNAYVALSQVADLARVTGYQTLTNIDKGNITLSIPTNIQIEFSPNLINWSNGTFDSGVPNATLTTSPDITRRVWNGTWWNGSGDGRDSGLRLINRGNVNVSINLNASQNATDIFGATRSSAYRWNVTENETGSCGIPFRYAQWQIFKEVNRAGGDVVCNSMSWIDAYNELRIDIQFVVPSDAVRTDYSTTVVATATAV